MKRALITLAVGALCAATVDEALAQQRVKVKIRNDQKVTGLSPELAVLLETSPKVELKAMTRKGEIVLQGAKRADVMSAAVDSNAIKELDFDDDDFVGINQLMIGFQGEPPSEATLARRGFTLISGSVRRFSDGRGMLLVRPRAKLNSIAAFELQSALSEKEIISAEPEFATYQIPPEDVLNRKDVVPPKGPQAANAQADSVNDPLFPKLWGLSNIHAADAWKRKSVSDVIVAVIDTGVDYTHPDIKDRMWVNQQEIPNNGRDDDGNGYIDDIHGIDFISGGTGDSDPFDDNGHGTHCAGTIAAIGNNGIGVVGVGGVNSKVRIMALKILAQDGFGGSRYQTVQAIEYAVRNGAKVISASFGGGDYSLEVKAAIERAGKAGVLFVAAAGNSTLDIGRQSNATYPAGYGLSNIIAVGAIGPQDQIATFSNYSSDRVDLGAPGVEIVSLAPNNQYRSLNGTSMATPHVSGAAAFVLATRAATTADGARDFLFKNSRQVAGLSNYWGHNELIKRPGAVLDLAVLASLPDSTQPPESKPENNLAGGGKPEKSPVNGAGTGPGGASPGGANPITPITGRQTSVAGFTAESHPNVTSHSDLTSVTVKLEKRSTVFVLANTSATSANGGRHITSLVGREPIAATVARNPDPQQGLKVSRRLVTLRSGEWTNFGTTFATVLEPGTHKLYWSVYVHPVDGRDDDAQLRFDSGTMSVTVAPME